MSAEAIKLRINSSNGIELDLSNLSLTEIPANIFELKNLELINLGGNKLTNLPDEIKKLTKLKTLFFANNLFESIPLVVGELKHLFMLSFKGNKLSAIDPRSLSPSIQWLILTDNEIKTLPTSIGQLTKLRKLMLSGNLLTALPDEMKNCRDLELIRLSSNRFESVPAWLYELPKLAWLAMSGNPMTTKGASLSTASPIPYSDFNILEKLGEGTSGIVSKAAWKAKGIDVALKIFKSLSTSDGSPKEEMRASLHIGKHPNMPEIFGSVTDDTRFGLVLSLVPKSYKSLGKPPSFTTVTRDNYSEGTVFLLHEVLSVLRGIASACAQLHQRGLSHGDIYAHNILYEKGGNLPVLLCDFGAATFYDKQAGMIIEPLEVRAWGILASELLALTDVNSSALTNERSVLERLKSQCLRDRPQERPSFSDILKSLSSDELVGSKNFENASNISSINPYHVGGIVTVAICAFVLFRIFGNPSSNRGNRESISSKIRF